MSTLGQDAAMFLTSAATRAETSGQTPATGTPAQAVISQAVTSDEVDVDVQGRIDQSSTGEDPRLIAEKVATALISGALREALGPKWTHNLHHPDTLARATSLADATAHILETTALHRAADLAGITIPETRITAAQVPELAPHVTREAIRDHLRREGARIAAASRDPRLVIGRGHGHIVVQHVASTLRIKFTPSPDTPDLGTVDARPYDIPVIGADSPDTWYSYLGLGIGTRLYRAAGDHLPHIRWITTQSTDATTAIRRRLHAENPYRWHWQDCPWCSAHLPAGWAESHEALFLCHPRTEPADTAPPHRKIASGLLVGLTGAVALALGMAALGGRPQTATGVATDLPASTTPPVSSAPATPSPSPISTPSPLTAAVPGYATRPAWAYAVEADTGTDVGPDGVVATRTSDGHVVVIDAVTGQAAWSSAGTYGASWEGPHLTRLDGQPAVALTSRDTFVYWPLPTSGVVGAAAGAQTPGPGPVGVSLPAGAHVIWTGPSPLIVLGRDTAALVHQGTLQPVPLPAGARPLADDGLDVLAVSGDTWIRARDGAAPTTFRFPAPPGVTGAPARVEAVAATYLLAIWRPENSGQSMVLLDAQSGNALVQTTLRDLDITQAPVVRQIGGTLTGVGSIVVNTGTRNLEVLSAQYKITSLTPGHTYATDTATHLAVDIRTAKKGTFKVIPLPAQAPTPIAVVAPRTGKPLALAKTSTPTGWLLQALPAL